MTKMTGGRAVVESLVAHNVDTVFGVISVHTMDLFDALRDAQDRIRYIGARHESAAAFMAFGYAQVTGRPGVIISSTGPGAGNAVGALGEAYAASLPVVHITTDVAPELRNSGRGEIHEPNDQLRMFKSVTAWNTFVEHAGGVPQAMFEAFEQIRTKRPKPVDVEIAWTALGETDDVEIPEPAPDVEIRPDPVSLERAVELLANAERPMILAGGGVHTSGATPELERVAERLGAAVATTYGGKGAISDDHPLALGCVRGGRVYGDNPIFGMLADADCVLVAGARLHYTITAAVGMPLPANMIHLDIDPEAFDKNYPAAVKLHGDAKLGLADLDAALERAGVSNREGLRSRIPEFRATIRATLEKENPHMQRVVDAMREAIPREAIVSVDPMIPAYWAVRAFPMYGPRQYVSSHAWTSIGIAFPAGLGAKAGRPDSPVVVIHGDGGFQLNMQELGTAVQYKLPITLVLFNDSAWGILKKNQERFRDGKYFATSLVNPDFVQLAAAYGIEGTRVDNIAGLQEALRSATRSGEMRLVEVWVPDGYENLV